MIKGTNKLCATVLVLALGLAGAAFAGGTPSGTPVDNAATVDFSVGGLNQATITSNTASFLVDNRVDVTVVTLDAANIVVVPGMLARVLSFSVTNNGNTIQDYALSAVADAADGFDATNVNVYLDVNGNGSYDAGVDNETYIDELPVDTTVTVFVVSDIPLTAANAELANYDLLAVTRGGVTPGVLGALLADSIADVDDPAVVQVVFADGAGNVDALRDGAHSSRSVYEVASANLLVVKTHAVVNDPINGVTRPKNIPGATLSYTTDLNNTGGAGADNVVVVDPVPGNTSFVVGSHTVAPAGTVVYSADGGVTWAYTPVDSGDGTDPAVTHMRITYGSIAAAGAAISTFQVVIQ
jgi:uncharacterized repeat protein (TIGR01451 family)